MESAFGKRRKVFVASNTHHVGLTAAANTTSRKHITAFVAVSASTRKAPPFFIVTGKNVMSNWVKPSSKNHLDERCNLQRFSKAERFRKAGLIKCTPRRSMDMDVLAAFVQHLDAFVRTNSIQFAGLRPFTA